MENTNKCLFVTGGSRGIGAGCARVFASRGYDVAFTYHSEESEAAKVAEEIRAMGRRCFYYQASMQDRDVPTEVTRASIMVTPSRDRVAATTRRRADSSGSNPAGP